jgi:ankyrin repeat protein
MEKRFFLLLFLVLFSHSVLAMELRGQKRKKNQEVEFQEGCKDRSEKRQKLLDSRLRASAQKGHTNIMQKLIAQGANVNARGADGEAPIHKAFEADNVKEVVSILLDHGANPGMPTRDHTRPLHMASCADLAPISVMWRLLQSGAQPDVVDDSMKLPLNYALDNSYLEAAARVQLLVNYGAITNIRMPNTELSLTEHANNLGLFHAESVLRDYPYEV